jgi:hypothetical protein
MSEAQGFEIRPTTVESPFFKDWLCVRQKKKLGTHFGDGCAYTKVLYRLLSVCRAL